MSRRKSEPVTGITCPECGDTDIIKAELKLSGGSYKQQYRCRTCRKRFFLDEEKIRGRKNKKKGLFTRLNKNTEQIEYICPYCDNILKYDEEAKTYHCEDCNVGFDKINNLEKADYKYITRKAKEVQRKRDELRIQNKILREDNRRLNALEDMGNRLIELFEKNKYEFKVANKNKKPKNEKIGGILQLSDPHFNELVISQDFVGNEYDFEIASKRCYKFVQDAKKQFDRSEIETVWFAMTGDIINSDRRLNELLMKASSRGQAWFIAKDIVKGMINDLLESGYKIKITGVSGNESRFDLDMENSHVKLTDNFDYMLYQQLKNDYANIDRIDFIDVPLSGGIVEFFGKRIFVSHGLEFPTGGNTQRNIQLINGKMCFKGVPFDYAIYGHEHSTNIGDFGARSSSIVGGNVYSDKRLNLSSKAAQNIHFVSEDFIHSMKIDLQTNYIDQYYEYNKELEIYDRKSQTKLLNPEKVIKIY